MRTISIVKNERQANRYAPPTAQIAMVAMRSVKMSSASVLARTCSTVTPGAVSKSLALPSGKSITASSLTTKLTGRAEVSGSVHCLEHFGLTLGRVLHRHDDALRSGDEIHCAAHAWHHLTGDHPVSEMSLLVDLKSAEHRHIDMTATDQAEGHGAVERARARQAR